MTQTPQQTQTDSTTRFRPYCTADDCDACMDTPTADEDLAEWLVAGHAKRTGHRVNMGRVGATDGGQQ